MCTLSVSKVIYHKFSHGAAFYTLNGKNVNVMLESMLKGYRSPEKQSGDHLNSDKLGLFCISYTYKS